MKVNKSAVGIMLNAMTPDEIRTLVSRLIENVETLNERIERLEDEQQGRWAEEKTRG